MSKKTRYYPLKPITEDGFKKAVAWFGGREFLASLKGTIVYMIYGENVDPRVWMKPNIFPDVEEKLKNKKADASEEEKVRVSRDEVTKKVNEFWKNKKTEQWNWKREHFRFWDEYLTESKFGEKINGDEIDELWFDFIADTGDGQMGVYSVACLCLSDLWLQGENIGDDVKFIPPGNGKNSSSEASLLSDDFEEKKILPRGSFLFVGGDTAYHSADYTTIFERFQSPFRWAFVSVRKFMWDHYSPDMSDSENKYRFVNQNQDVEPIRKDYEFDIKRADGTEEKAVINDFNRDWDGTIAEIEGERVKKWDTEPTRPLFGIPANHDYYDAIAGFNKQFRRPPYKDIEENVANVKFIGGVPLKIHTFARKQEASYNAMHLPFNWWMFGIDSENQKLDHRQEVFYREIVRRWKPKKLILATPEPTTVFGRKCAEDDKTAKYLAEITWRLGYEQPFLTDGQFVESSRKKKESDNDPNAGKQCRLDLSGDIHHYARYWGPNVEGTVAEEYQDDQCSAENYASVVSGGGGAFFDSTDTLIGEREVKLKNGGTEIAEGEIPPQALFPGKKESIRKLADKIFDLWNIKKGGYVQNIGAIIAIIIFFNLTQNYSNVGTSFRYIESQIKVEGFSLIFSLLSHPFESIWNTYDSGLVIFFIFLIMSILLGLSGWYIGRLNQYLETHKRENTYEKLEIGRLKNLLVRFSPIVLALILYGTVFLPWQGLVVRLEGNSYNNTWFLIYHFVFAGILVWVARQYQRWVKLRKEISRNSTERTVLEMMRDSNVQPEGGEEFVPQIQVYRDSVSRLNPIRYILNPVIFFIWQGRNILKKIQRYLGQLSREYVFEYIPDTILYLIASMFIVIGVGFFGRGSMVRTAGDLMFIIAFFGVFVLVAGGLGISTGGSYQSTKGKYLTFGILGTCHGLLQVLTPFVLIYYGHWVFVILYYFVLVYFNGIAWSKKRFTLLINEKERVKGLRAKLTKWANSTLGTRLMKKNSTLLTVVGFLFGLFTLAVPLILTFGIETENTMNKVITKVIYQDWLNPHIISMFEWLAYYLPTKESQLWLTETFSPRVVKWLPIVTVLAIVGWIGYKMSRVWLSWYLAISLKFNGHNNESGGLARIEDFKHILRIRVRKEKLTVFVIGIDEAKPDLKMLKPKLVDKFDLFFK